MEGFYSKVEAANILSVSARQINNYMKGNPPLLRSVYQGKRVWIPHEDVEKMLTQIRSRKPIDLPAETEDLKSRLAKLEGEMEVMKLSLGYGMRRKKTRTLTDMLLLRQKYVNLLARTAWDNRCISDVTDDVIGLRPEELMPMYEKLGDAAWIPLTRLMERMLVFLEDHPEYPANGFDVLRDRMIRAKDRFYGLLYATARTPAPSAPSAAQLEKLAVSASAMDTYILDYILRS